MGRLLFTDVEYGRFSLDEPLKLQVTSAISREALISRDSIEVRTMLDGFTDQMLVQLEATIRAKRNGGVVVGYPATPWDHWKSAWLPRLGPIGRWYLRRHPVREDFVAASSYVAFPEARLARKPPGLGPEYFMLADLEGPK